MRPTTALALAASALLLAAGLAAQHKYQHCCPDLPGYDPATEVTLTASVQEVVEHHGYQGWYGVHLIVEADGSSVEAHIGPLAYLAAQQFEIAAGDEIEVVGSKVQAEDKIVLIARKVVVEGNVLELRDEDGKPRW